MADGLAKEPRAAGVRARRRCGGPACEPKLTIVRGGTDGSRLTEMGLPTPNLSTRRAQPALAAGVDVPGRDGDRGARAGRAGAGCGARSGRQGAQGLDDGRLRDMMTERAARICAPPAVIQPKRNTDDARRPVEPVAADLADAAAVRRHDAGRRLRPGGAAGLGRDHHDRRQGAGSRRGEDPRRATARCPPTGPCRPSGGPFPVVLVVQEIFGVHEHIKDVCRRFAKLGYLAVAPELYARQGDVSKITDIKEIISKVVSKVPDAQVMSDLDATVAWAKKTRQGRHGEAGHHRLLLGRPDRLAVRGPQQGPEGGRGLVRPAGRRQADELHPKHPIDLVGSTQGPGAGPVRRGRQGHPGRDGREDAEGPQGRRASRRRSSSTPTRRTASTPTTGPATARRRPRTAGSGCWSGSRRTAWRRSRANEPRP